MKKKTGYMIRAPTFGAAGSRRQAFDLQLNTAAPQNFRRRGETAEIRRAYDCGSYQN